jgi:hypothetical protein
MTDSANQSNNGRFVKGQRANPKGNVVAARGMMDAIEHTKAAGLVGRRIGTIIRSIVDPGSVTKALDHLHMAKKLDRYRETAKMMLEPWLAEMASARLGNRRLDIEQQKEIVTRTPTKVGQNGGRLTICPVGFAESLNRR